MSGENVSDVIVPTFIRHSSKWKNSNDSLFETTSFSCCKLNFAKLPSIYYHSILIISYQERHINLLFHQTHVLLTCAETLLLWTKWVEGSVYSCLFTCLYISTSIVISTIEIFGEVHLVKLLILLFHIE